MNLKKQLGSSTAWMSLAATGNSAISFVIFIMLSRILSPRDIGLIAFALILVELGKMMINVAFSQAIIQREQWDETYAATCFYSNLIFSTIVSLAMIFVAAPLVAHYYDPQAGPIVKVLSVIFFLEGLNAVHEGKLKRDFAFNVVAVRSVLASFLSGITGVYLALKGYGVWALVAQQVTYQVCVTLVTQYSAKWIPPLRFSSSNANQLFTFAVPIIFAQVISNFGSKIVEFLIGILIGPAALGFYRVGGRALYILQDVVLKPLEYTSLSALSRLQQAAQQAEGCLRIIRMGAYVTVPIFFGAAAIAPEFIIFAFGEKWAMSGQLMMILALGIAPIVISQQVNSLLTAGGYSRLVMLLAAMTFVSTALIAWFTIPYGLVATAWGFTARTYLSILFGLYLFKRVYQVGIMQVVTLVAPSFLAAAVMFGAVMGTKNLLENRVPMLVEIIIACGIGACVYTLCMAAIFKSATRIFIRESADLAPQKFKPVIHAIQHLMKLT